MKLMTSVLLAAGVLWLASVTLEAGPAVEPVRAVASPLSPSATWTPEDWAVVEDKTRWALGQGLNDVPLGTAVATLGRTFVGTPYVPHTLERSGPEELVINFAGLDCVTLVENVLALARFVRLPDVEGLLQDPPSAQGRYENLLREIRYRGGVLDGYPSRLHYFSDWIRDNHARGLVRDLTAELGGVPVSEPVRFMSDHPEAYAALADPANLHAIQVAETALTATPRFFLPEALIAESAHAIQDGDVIAATSTVPGLDVAHTGLALWVDGELHLLHAPLVGSAVEVSQRSLARRIVEMDGQDGILVARPVER